MLKISDKILNCHNIRHKSKIKDVFWPAFNHDSQVFSILTVLRTCPGHSNEGHIVLSCLNNLDIKMKSIYVSLPFDRKKKKHIFDSFTIFISLFKCFLVALFLNTKSFVFLIINQFFFLIDVLQTKKKSYRMNLIKLSFDINSNWLIAMLFFQTLPTVSFYVNQYWNHFVSMDFHILLS